MTRRKQKIGLYDLGRLPLTPVNDEGRPSLRKFTEQYNREQQEIEARRKVEQMAPVLAAQQEYSKTLVALRKAQAGALFIVRSEELENLCSHVPDDVEGSVEEIRAEIKNAFTTGLPGIDIHESGLKKIREVAAKNPTIDIRRPSNWRKIYDYMSDLGVFTSEDVTVPQPVAPAVQPEPTEQGPTMDDLMSLRVTGYRDLGVAQDMADKLYESEMLPIYQQWAGHLVRDHNYHLTREDADIIEKWFVRNNKARLRHESYNEARRYMILGIRRWPDTMLTSDEKLARFVEQGDTRSFEGRQDIFRQMNNQ